MRNPFDAFEMPSYGFELFKIEPRLVVMLYLRDREHGQAFFNMFLQSLIDVQVLADAFFSSDTVGDRILINFV